MAEATEYKLTDSLKDRIVELAREDAQSDIYMGNKFLALQRAEVRKVAPDRAALMRMFVPEGLALSRLLYKQMLFF